jgi:electron transport complex protein RnfD
LLTVAPPPFVHCGASVPGMTLVIIAALVPAMCMAVYHFGLPALRVLALAAASAVVAEVLCDKLMEREPGVNDGQALLVGVLTAFLLPAGAAWWLAVAAPSIAIVLGKMVFGGLGTAPLPAPLVGWAVCRLSWPRALDPELTMLSSALESPMAQLKHHGLEAVADVSLTQLFLGGQLGGLGGVQVAGVLLGGIALVAVGRIRWEIPVAYLGGLLVAAAAFSALEPGQHPSPLFHLLAGQTMFGAFFLATSESSSPHRRTAMLIYGALAGILTILIRVYGRYPDGVVFAILVACLFTPMLTTMTQPKPFGAAKARK